MSLDYHAISHSQGVMKAARSVLKGPRSQFEEASTGSIWDNLSIKKTKNSEALKHVKLKMESLKALRRSRVSRGKKRVEGKTLPDREMTTNISEGLKEFFKTNHLPSPM